MNAPTELAPLRPVRLAQLGALLLSGPDVRPFLQGQLSADMETLQPGLVLPAACNSAQGRVQAVVWLVERTDGVALLLPADAIDTITERLRKYVLRAKVTFAPPSALTVGVAADGADGGVAHAQRGDVSFIRLPGHSDTLALSPVADWPAAAPEQERLWRLEHIRAGLAQIYPPTYESFVAQMLNLDLIGAISFEKGCYTGQEIIARAHYRGAVKRRMFRFAASCSPAPPGARILADGQRAGEVVDAAASDGGCELLAVISLSQLDQRLTIEDQPDAALELRALPYEPPRG